MNGNENDGQSFGRIIVKFKDDFSGKDQFLQDQFGSSRFGKLFFSLDPEKISALVNRARSTDRSYLPVDFLSYYFIQCNSKNDSDTLIPALLSFENIELAYLENCPGNPPSVISQESLLGHRQGFLDAAPEGINARFAWQIPGGNGEGDVKFIDIEQGWLLDHKAYSVKTLSCTGLNHYMYDDHGAAVLGIILMQDKERGVTGITPKAGGYVVSQWRPDGSFNNSDAIMAAIAHLDFGDILLLESQTYDSPDSPDAWPVEMEEATFQAIRLATALGIVVIETAGNGNIGTSSGNDLDLFEINGKQIFNPAGDHFRDSGAILVAAATSTVPHTRIGYSNYGKRVNCFAWGEKIITAGSYPGSSGFAINRYTEKFGGTSGASAIIAGAAIAIQSIAEANFSSRLSPKQMRTFLSSPSLGSTSANGQVIDKIGVMPDLQKIIIHALQLRPRHMDSHSKNSF